MFGTEDVPLVASPAASPGSEEDDLASVSALESELVDDETKSLRFGKTSMTEEVFKPLVEKNTLNKDLVRLSKDEKVPKPEPDECVVFKDYFIVGLHFPI